MATQTEIAYLSGTYARASDTFVRDEVDQLRQLGFKVHTIGIRRPIAGEDISPKIAEEQARTLYVLTKENLSALIWSTLSVLLFSPLKAFNGIGLAQGCSDGTLTGRFKSLVYFVEACFVYHKLKDTPVRHIHNHIAEGAAVVSMIAADLLGITFSMTIHGPGEFDKALTINFDKKIDRAAFAATVSSYGKSQIFRWIRPSLWDKVHLVRCAPAEAFANQPAVPIPADRRLVFVGRLSPDKGVLFLAGAVKELAASGDAGDFHVSMIGDGPLRKELEDFIATHGLQRYVTIHGWKTSSEIREALVGSRGLVLPSFAENLPVSIMECLAVSRPVISTYIGGITELVEDGVSGWLIPAASQSALVAALQVALSQSPEALLEMGQAGARRIAEQHNAASEAKKLAGLIEKAITEASP